MADEASARGAGDAESTRRVAVAWMDAVSSCDEKAALALSSETIVYTSGGHIRRYEGHDGVRDIVEDFARLSGFLIATVLSTVAEPGIVAIKRIEKYTLPSGGLVIAACSFVEVDDGVVTRWADFKDSHALNPFSA